MENDQLAATIEDLKNSILTLSNSIDDLNESIHKKKQEEISQQAFDKLGESIDRLATGLKHFSLKQS